MDGSDQNKDIAVNRIEQLARARRDLARARSAWESATDRPTVGPEAEPDPWGMQALYHQLQAAERRVWRLECCRPE